MRPFLCSLLTCTKCSTVKCQKLSPVAIKAVSLPKHIPSVSGFKKEEGFLSDLIATISKSHSKVLDVCEADLYAFMESTGEDESRKIVELLYGLDVITGTVVCVECGETKNIRDGILFCEEPI